MKSIELFCASPASTAICSSMEQYSMVRHGMRQVDRHTHRLGDRLKTRTPTCLSELPIDPRRSFHQKSRKSSTKPNEIRRKSSADIKDLKRSPSTSSIYLLPENTVFQSSSALVPYNEKHSVNERLKLVNTCEDLAVFRSSSARSSHESRVYKSPSTTLVKSNETSVKSNDKQFYKLPSTTLARPSHESPVYRLSSEKSNDMQLHKPSSTPTRNQVVELRVSIHCKGCEGKVRKHLSKMEGVTSFSIDLVSKKVTVVGNVTPLSVLASMSKVKNAQFWPSPTSSTYSSSSTSSSSSSMSSRRA